MRAALAWLIALLAFAALPAAAQDYPARPQGPVLDAANIIPDAQQATLDARLRDYNQRTGRALVVATVPSLGGETIEMYAVRLFEQWGIGGKETDQGLLLLVAPTERKVRIEVGYGLHQYVTDALSGRIIRNEITPRFKAGDMAGGIEAGVNALIIQLDRDPAEARAVAEAAAAGAAQGRREAAPGLGGVFFWLVLIVFFMAIFGRGRRRHGRRYSRGMGGLGPIILWETLNHMGGNRGGGGFGGGGFGGGGGGGFGGFGGGMSGGGGASGGW